MVMRPPRHLPAPDSRSTRSLFVRLAILIFLLIAAFQSISFYVESLWYGSLGFESVYWYRLRTQSLVFLVTATITAIVLWTIFRLVTPPPGYSRRSFVRFGQEEIVIPSSDTLKGFFAGVDHPIIPKILAIGDYARGHVTLGARIEAVKNFRVDLYAPALKSFGGGFTYTRRM